MNERSFIVKRALRSLRVCSMNLHSNVRVPCWPATCRPRRAACSRSPSKRVESKPLRSGPSRFLGGSAGLQPAHAGMLPACPATASSGFVCEAQVGLVMRYNRRRLRCRVPPSEGIRRRLPDKLPDCGDCTQNAQRVDHHFHHAPALLFRADQKRVCRFRFVVHNFKTPRSCRFV